MICYIYHTYDTYGSEEMKLNLAERYYREKYGCYPFDDETNMEKTMHTIEYLRKNNVSNSDIIKVIEESKKNDYLDPEELPDWLWNNSLIEKGKFYYHSSLHITPGAPTWNPATGEVSSSKYYIEIKIMFTEDDLLDYFYRKAIIPQELIERKRDLGAIKHMLGKYQQLKFISALDFVLYLIDASCESGWKPNSVFDIKDKEREAFSHFESIVEMAEYEGANKIIWGNSDGVVY